MELTGVIVDKLRMKSDVPTRKGKGTNLDVGFRVLKLGSGNMNDAYYEPSKFTEHDLFEDNIKSDRTSEDLLCHYSPDTQNTVTT